MKKSLSWRQAQYLDSRNMWVIIHSISKLKVWHFILLVFHGFQWKCIRSLVASTSVVHFLQVVFMKALKVLFSICQIKISNNLSHSLPMYDIFNGENSKLITLTTFMSAQAGFLWCIEIYVPKNIITLILETVIWDYSWGKVTL